MPVSSGAVAYSHLRDRHSQAASDSEMPVRMPSPFSRKSWLTDQSFTGLRLLRGCAGHSLHLLFGLPCGQMALPPHSLHSGFRLPCAQTALPPHSLHVRLSLPCGQMLLPPHSLHLLLCLPCSHFACFRPLPSLVEGAPRFRDPVPSFTPSASPANVRSSVCGSKPLGPLRISGSSDGSGLIGFAAAEEEARPHDSYATTQHSSSIADATLPRWQPTKVSIPDLAPVNTGNPTCEVRPARRKGCRRIARRPGVCLRRRPQRTCAHIACYFVGRPKPARAVLRMGA